MLEIVNRIFVAILVALALCGIIISLVTIATDFLGDARNEFDFMQMSTDISIASAPILIESSDSPYLLNITVLTPQLEKGDLVKLKAYTNGKPAAETECISNSDRKADIYVGKTNMSCELGLPYGYNSSQEFGIYPVLHRGEEDIYSGPYRMRIEWPGYEYNLQGAILFVFAIVACAYLLFVLPLGFMLFYQGMRTQHKGAWEGEYTLESLFNPLKGGKTLFQKFEAFLISPYFWGLESIGIAVILAYLFITAGAWRSFVTLSSFVLAGLVAFIIPFLWCTVFWYADFREREPLRILTTFFLWGALAALMAVGINTVLGAAFGLLGLGFVAIMLVAPLTEELFKGSGLALLSEHHEFDSLEDGLVFGFVIGMGFAFIENWIYLIQNPFSADIGAWIILFLVRSVVFSTNHGVYTAIVGGVIGLLNEKKIAAPALGLIPGVVIAFLFHAVHNSGPLLADVFGVRGLLAYLCILIPMFDYGGLIMLLLLFAWAMLRKR